MKDLSQMGPIQVLAVSFDQADFKGKIMDQLKKLRDQKFIRVVDALAVHKAEGGEISAVEATDLTEHEATEYGAIIGALIGLGSGSEETAKETSAVFAERFHERYEYGLDREDLEDMAESIPEGGTTLILALEHTWAIPLRNSLREAGGVLMAQDFLSPELLASIGQGKFAN